MKHLFWKHAEIDNMVIFWYNQWAFNWKYFSVVFPWCFKGSWPTRISAFGSRRYSNNGQLWISSWAINPKSPYTNISFLWNRHCFNPHRDLNSIHVNYVSKTSKTILKDIQHMQKTLLKLRFVMRWLRLPP